MGDSEVRALTAGTGLKQLRILNLSHNNITLNGIKTLVQWPASAALQWLDLSGNKIGDTGAKALVKSQYLRNLRHLAVGGSGKTRLRKHFGNQVVS
jgi:Leucine-rich repeat (LRR) protein